MRSSTAAALAAFAGLLPHTAAHSWIEQLTLIDSTGVFTGTPGYPRNFSSRTAPGFTDNLFVHLLPPSDPLEARDVDTEGIKPTDPMCKKSQQQQYQSDGFPRLSATPGSMIALRYQENGHVTLPQNQPGKPGNRGNVSIYGTSEPKPDENFLDVFKQWNSAGTGGDKRGKLLATQPYDDGQCYQVNGGTISKSRQEQYPHGTDELTGKDIWCQNDIKLPADLPTGKSYTLYWVWDWPTEPGVDPGLPKGKAEVYTSCMDIDIKAGGQSRSLNEVRDMTGQNVNNMAIPSYMALMTQPAASSGDPAQSAPAPASTPATNSFDVQQKQQVAGTQSTEPAPSSTLANSEVEGSPSASQAMDLPSAELLVLSALGSKLVSEIAADVMTQAPVVTVTKTVNQAPAAAETGPPQIPATQTAAASSVAPQNTASPLSPAVPSSAVHDTAAQNPPNTATSPFVVSGMPPTSLNVGSPILSPTSGGAPAPVTSGASGIPTFAGTASPMASGQGDAAVTAGGKRSCATGRCRKMKRSRIFGSQK
ncbi:MAG: hypothetical protein Q9163_003529 [Psora crenata]